jgi:hypothetical protein
MDISKFTGDFSAPPQQAQAPAPQPDRPELSLLDDITESHTDGDLGNVVDFDSIADFLETAISNDESETEKTTLKSHVTEHTQKPATVNAVESSPEMVEIGVEMYVEILETLSSYAAGIYAGDESSEFTFEKKLKERYKKITAIYAETQNVKVSPGFLFGAFTFLLIAQMGYKAHKRKQEVIRAAAFRQKIVQKQVVPGKQISLFETEKQPKAVISSGAGYMIPDAEKNRKDWSTDEKGRYKKTANGDYIKESDRAQKPCPEIAAFINDYFSEHLQKPSNKAVKAYLKTI